MEDEIKPDILGLNIDELFSKHQLNNEAQKVCGRVERRLRFWDKRKTEATE